MKTARMLWKKIGLLILGGFLILLTGVLFLRSPLEAAVKKPTLTVETPQKINLAETETLTLDVSISDLGDVPYPAASVSIRFDPSRLEFLGVEEGNVFVRDETVGQRLPTWNCSPVQCNRSGLINVMYLDLTGGKRAFDKELLSEEGNVLLRLSFRLRGSARAGDVYDLTVEDAVFAASDETESLAVTRSTLRVRNGRVIVGG
ncbi:MAG: hypothetical protein E7445_10120 [Ruminococcaceae bacterium]|nr:hypothetical protein [Oscillospiraceae bacterium]